MHVPYSMDDREPDLYGGMGGYNDDEYNQTKWEGNGYSSDRDHELDAALYAFRKGNYCYTQEDMTKVIQKNLEAVHSLRLDVQELIEILRFIYDHAENLPQGVSQIIREQLTKGR